MYYVILSLKSLKEESLKLAQIVGKDYKPDLVVYIARGGYLIGKDIADYFHVPCVGIYAERRGGGLKEKISPFLRILPGFLKKILRKIELKSGIHNVDKERNVYWDSNDFANIEKIKINHILLVDDSVDTGHSMYQVKEKLTEDFGNNSTIKTVAINVWDTSLSICKTDYYIYRNTIITSPMSKDSEEYPIFEELYNNRV